MDPNRFDALSRALTSPGSRRSTLRTLLSTLLGGALLGSSPDAPATAAKTKAKSRKASGRGGNGGGDNRDRRPPHDHQVGQDRPKTKTGRQKGTQQGPEKQQRTQQRPEPKADDAATVEPVPEATAPARGEVAGEEVTATSHGCRHAGVRCRRGSQCCTGKCLRSGGKKKCSCDTSNPCPTPADPCKTAVCSATGRCVIQNKCQREAPQTCGQTGECSAGTCLRYAEGSECGSHECFNDSEVLIPSCDERGACGPRQFGCASGFCDPATGTCGSCSRDDDCGSNRWCDSGNCRSKQANGTTCRGNTPQQCASGLCVTGFCCASACRGPNVSSLTCAGGTCVLTCMTGWGNCDNDTSNGCETDVTSDEEHCRECDQPCPACGEFEVRECVDGQCTCTQ